MTTREVLDAGGWLRTGDIGIIQEDGYIRLVDRKEGHDPGVWFQCFPNEIEDVAMSCPRCCSVQRLVCRMKNPGGNQGLFIVASG